MADDGVIRIGESPPRKEDGRLITGKGCYSDDVTIAGQLYAVMVRSPYAHAILKKVDATAAAGVAGVIAVLTDADYQEDGCGDLPSPGYNPAHTYDYKNTALANRDGTEIFSALIPPLVRDKVRHIGEPVAMIVAETENIAKDAAELVFVDYEILPAVTDVSAALAPGAPEVWGGAPGNVGADGEHGDEEATNAAFDAADHVVTRTFITNRVVNAQMEPRAATAVFDGDSGELTLHTGSQGAFIFKMMLAQILSLDPEKMRVITRDVGGGFGPRGSLYREFILVAWAAMRLLRPVKWVSDRSEAFISDHQCRDLKAETELALDKDGRFLGMRVHLMTNVGAHAVSYVPLSNGLRLVPSVYDIPSLYVRYRGILTNTLSVSVYRGAGRPEAIFHMERLVDMAARKLGIDRAEIRRRNIISPDAMPYTSAAGLIYDCGEFESIMDQTLALAGWKDLDARKIEARTRGKRLGFGFGNYVEAPVGAIRERVEVKLGGDGRVTIVAGTQSTGQGHETTYAQVVSDQLSVPFDAIDLITGDTDVVKLGGGTHSNRSMRIAGTLIVECDEEIIETGRQAAAVILEAGLTDIIFENGTFTVTGTDRSVGIFEAAAALETGRVKGFEDQRLAADADFEGRIPAFPNGCAAAEVEVDIDTGAVIITRYSQVDDVGRAINPMIVDGQVHGGIVQGVGQALMENCVYEPGSGQLLSGSFMDYALMRAGDVPSFAVKMHEVPSPGNPLGVKGGGEGGTTPAMATIINAIADALEEFGVDHLDLPATPEKIWRAIHQ
ncbi:MAG: xanthine dehydrogenase family protein molybdopterin-binding subunit [Rhodospirillales bacterium]|nr:xanthine dehydrogenase family protein molybdopterin-binding subunit [Rhodospirillales bacterium]